MEHLTAARRRKFMLFFEAFDQLKADQELQKLFQNIEVLKVQASKKSPNLYICMQSPHLISRFYLRKMEELMNRQLFIHTGNLAILKPQVLIVLFLSIQKMKLVETLSELSVRTLSVRTFMVRTFMVRTLSWNSQSGLSLSELSTLKVQCFQLQSELVVTTFSRIL